MYVLPSAPFTTTDWDDGSLIIKSPSVWGFNRMRVPRWIPVHTPSCPDLDYCSLYYSGTRDTLYLVLVQRPPSQAPFSRVFDRGPADSRLGAKSSGNGTRCEGQTNENAGRIVGHFALKKGSENSIYAAFKDDNLGLESTFSDVWEPLPVSDGLADFFSLGTRLPGEVRISSAILNPDNLRPVRLVRTPIGDGPEFTVEVVKDGEEPLQTPSRPMTPWLQHQDSPYHGVPSTVIEERLNVYAKEDETLLDSLKKRQLLHPLGANARPLPRS